MALDLLNTGFRSRYSSGTEVRSGKSSSASETTQGIKSRLQAVRQAEWAPAQNCVLGPIDVGGMFRQPPMAKN